MSLKKTEKVMPFPKNGNRHKTQKRLLLQHLIRLGKSRIHLYDSLT